MFTIIFLESESGSGGSDWCGVVVVLVLLALLIRYVARQRQIKEAQAADEEDQEALRLIKRNPTNADYKEHALHLGRAYCNLSRNLKGQGGVTIYDEVALMNDINAACASTQHAVHAQAPAPVAQQESHESRLRRLNDLYDQKLIDEQAYLRRKQEIINSI